MARMDDTVTELNSRFVLPNSTLQIDLSISKSSTQSYLPFSPRHSTIPVRKSQNPCVINIASRVPANKRSRVLRATSLELESMTWRCSVATYVTSTPLHCLLKRKVAKRDPSQKESIFLDLKDQDNYVCCAWHSKYYVQHILTFL
jgi:hypothetical protein